MIQKNSGRFRKDLKRFIKIPTRIPNDLERFGKMNFRMIWRDSGSDSGSDSGRFGKIQNNSERFRMTSLGKIQE